MMHSVARARSLARPLKHTRKTQTHKASETMLIVAQSSRLPQYQLQRGAAKFSSAQFEYNLSRGARKTSSSRPFEATERVLARVLRCGVPLCSLDLSRQQNKKQKHYASGAEFIKRRRRRMAI